MNTIYTKLFFGVAALLLSCQPSNASGIEGKSKYFKVIKAVKSSQYPGVQGSPIARTVEVTVVVRKKGNFSIDTCWFMGMKEAVHVFRAGRKVFDGNVKKGDTLILVCQVYQTSWDPAITPEQDRLPGSATSPAPSGYTGDLVFRYNRCGKIRYFGIKKAESGPDIYAP